MAELVLGLATSHLTHVLEMPETGDPEQVARFRAGFTAMRQLLTQAAPEALLVLAGEHVNHFFLDNMPAFCIGVMETVAGPVEAKRRNIGVPWRTVRGAVGLAHHLLIHGLQDGVDWAYSEHWELDHGMMLPLYLLDPEARIPVVPVFINTAAPPLPSLRRCYEVGRWLGDTIRRWPSSLRIAALATGGLSHSVGTEKMGWIDEDFDREFLTALCEQPSRLRELADARVEAAGNATAEVRAWVALAGMFHCLPASLIFYAPIVGFGTGCAQAAFVPRGVPGPLADGRGGASNDHDQ